MTKEQNDIASMKGDIEKLTRHLTKQEKTSEDQSIMLLNIQTALLGTEFNEKKGMVYILNDIDKRVRIMEKKHNEYDVYVSQGKWALGIMATAVVGFFIFIIKKLNGF